MKLAFLVFVAMATLAVEGSVVRFSGFTVCARALVKHTIDPIRATNLNEKFGQMRSPAFLKPPEVEYLAALKKWEAMPEGAERDSLTDRFFAWEGWEFDEAHPFDPGILDLGKRYLWIFDYRGKLLVTEDRIFVYRHAGVETLISHPILLGGAKGRIGGDLFFQKSERRWFAASLSGRYNGNYPFKDQPNRIAVFQDRSSAELKHVVDAFRAGGAEIFARKPKHEEMLRNWWPKPPAN